MSARYAAGDDTDAALHLTGDYDQNHTFDGEDNVNLLLSGRALRELFDMLEDVDWWEQIV